MIWFLQELADAWETTRQDIINDLIQEFIIQDWENKRMIDKQKDEEFDNSTTTRYFLLNTNSANDLEDHNFMMTNQVAAAFEDGYKEKICRIKKGDYVFLYASGQGIVDIWSSQQEYVEKTHHYGVDNKTFFQKLEHFVDLSQNPIKARQVKSIFRTFFSFCPNIISDYWWGKTFGESQIRQSKATSIL